MVVPTTRAVRVGPVLIDVPRSLGYFGAVAVAVGLGLVEPPLGLFIAAVPALKVLTHGALPMPVRFVGEVIEGAATPVGGDEDAYVRLHDARRGNHGDQDVDCRVAQSADTVVEEPVLSQRPIPDAAVRAGERDVTHRGHDRIWAL